MDIDGIMDEFMNEWKWKILKNVRSLEKLIREISAEKCVIWVENDIFSLWSPHHYIQKCFGAYDEKTRLNDQ